MLSYVGCSRRDVLQEPSHFCGSSLEFKYCSQYRAVDTEEGERKEDSALRKTSGMRKN